MSQSSDNRKRAFADVVTIDAWHEPFCAESPRVDLHADVVFGTARIGGESDSQVRFRLSVKRADVVVVIPALEPVSVDRSSVSRDTPEHEGHLTETHELASQTDAFGSVGGSITRSGASASASTGISGRTSATKTKKMELSSQIRSMEITQSKTPEGYYRWIVEPRTSNILRGRPWDAAKQPRLRLIDIRRDASKGIPPTVRVEVWCRREDLLIEDLQTKDENLWERVTARVGFENRLAAAESYIRDRLSEEGLEVRNFEDLFGHMTLGSTTAEPN